MSEAARVSVSESFVDVWDPSEVPHLEITGQHGSGKSEAVQRIAAQAMGDGAEVRLILDVALAPTSLWVATSPEEALGAIESTLRDLNWRLAELEEERLTGAKAPAVQPVVLLVDGFTALMERPTSNPTVPARIREYLGDLLALGGKVDIHVVLTGISPSFTRHGHRNGIGQVVLGPISPATRVQLSSGDYLVAELPIRPIGSGWYFRSGGHMPQPVGF